MMQIKLKARTFTLLPDKDLDKNGATTIRSRGQPDTGIEYARPEG